MYCRNGVCERPGRPWRHLLRRRVLELKNTPHRPSCARWHLRCADHPFSTLTPRLGLPRSRRAGPRPRHIRRSRIRRKQCALSLFCILHSTAHALHAVGGVLIGALFVQLASWRWVFWFTSVLSLPVAGLVLLLTPAQPLTGDRLQPAAEKLRRLDLPGVAVITAGLLLVIFGVTEGNTAGWASPMVLAPLVIAVALLIPGFFVYERMVPARYAAVYVVHRPPECIRSSRAGRPPRTWFYPNFAVLFGVGLLPNLCVVVSSSRFRAVTKPDLAGGPECLPCSSSFRNRCTAGPRS
jgi:hypothetical protein